MIAALLATLLGASVSCAQGTPCSTSITFTMTIVPTSTLTIDVAAEGEGWALLTVESFTSGVVDARSMFARYAMVGDGPFIASPDGYKAPTETIVVAIPAGAPWPEPERMARAARASGRGAVAAVVLRKILGRA